MGKYEAAISVNGVQGCLGYFDTVEEAARAYARVFVTKQEYEKAIA
jgi:hypothetical protein